MVCVKNRRGSQVFDTQLFKLGRAVFAKITIQRLVFGP